MDITILNYRPAGYAYLIDLLGLSSTVNWHQSFVSHSSKHQIKSVEGVIQEIYPARYWPGEKIGDHLEFALKYDGVHLALLSQIFECSPMAALMDYIQSKPTGKYARKIWFLYEFLLEKKLPIDDLTIGNYIEILDDRSYYTINNGEKSSRHRIINNLLGVKGFCPVVRKSKKLLEYDEIDLRQKCEDIVTTYPSDLLRRAFSYLYSKETKSSFEIEHVKPNASRIEKFIAALTLAQKSDFCEKQHLIELQNLIVDPRFQDQDYRVIQNYIGQTVAYQNEIIHFICPKPNDIHCLMSGLIATHQRLIAGNVSPIIHAAIIAYGFVFLHPFEDGNGRIHRFLIHNILSLRGVVPSQLIFPVSAVMLKNPKDYDASLEAFSRPLLQLIDYSLDDMGKMTVENETARWYQYMDMSVQSEYLYAFVMMTIEKELVEELAFIENYDQTKRNIQSIIDMPDRLIDLLIQLCLQNNGHLSTRKRQAHFDFLTDTELTAIELAVKNGYKKLT